MVRKQVIEHKGFEVKSMGDGFMVAFSSARRALLCAIGIQRATTDYSREHPTQPIRVRIGLHTGEAISEGGDFFGKSVIMAARIAAKARAGEILVSSVFKAVTESAGDLQFDEGYDVELKGLSGSYRVHRALWSNDPAANTPHGDEPARATLMAASRQTTESASPKWSRRRRRLLIAAGIGAFFVVKGFFDRRPVPENRPPRTSPPVQSVAPAPAPEGQAPPATAPPADAQPPAAAAKVSINAPGISVEQREKALKTVANWLNLLDQGRFWKAWEQSTFQIPKPQWVQNQRRLHDRRGLAISRKLESEERSPVPNGNPQRMLFRYQTQFEKGKPVTESVFAIPKPDGQWVVTGYFVKFEPDTAASP
jgi:hypothetical protein